MKKRWMALLCAGMLSVGLLAGCGSTEKADDTASSKTEETEETKETETEEKVEQETEKEVEEGEAAPENTETSADLGDTWVNMESRRFAVNGNVYELGVTTLQDMIDDGVPFDEDDIANANNNINSNEESAGFSIVLGEYYNAQVSVGNFTDGNLTMAECPINQVYLPVDLEESNEILTFAFPLTMTEDELQANAGEPTDTSYYEGDDNYVKNDYEYTVESERYYGDSGYKFEFTNGELSYVTIDWLP